uniref:Uncharacterized protein n=1 Tax=Arundo donax TaxID=35708 RepID=A0A0A9A8C1_ARUDO
MREPRAQQTGEVQEHCALG